MKKTMLIGRTGCGKTTLTQKLMDEEVKYKKTQAVTYKSKIIDTPGEYVENKMYMFPKKEVIGVITKIDLENANVERSRKFLIEAGATEVFTIGLNDEEGLEAIKKRLVTNES